MECPKVTEADIAEYHERGYWLSPKIFNDEQIEKLCSEVCRLQSGEKDTDSWGWCGPVKADPEAKHMQQVVNAWWVNDAVREAVTSPVIGYIGSRLMRVDGIRLIHDQALIKPGLGAEGEDSLEGNFGWHQDYSYWDWVNTENLCTCWVALQDTDISMGAMRTLVGSHRWGYNPKSDTAGIKDLKELRGRFEQEGHEWIDEPCIMKAGQASFHHSLTYHGSGPNTTNEPRLSVVSHLMPDGSAYDSTGKWNRMLSLFGPDLKHGHKFEEAMFPKLWPIDVE